MNPGTARQMRQCVAGHDWNVRAAVNIATASTLNRKISDYIDLEDGWVDWQRLADDLAAGLPWSSGELRLARLACSLAGEMPDQLRDHRAVYAWSLADMLTGLDETNTAVAVEALTLAATGRTGGIR